MLRLWTVALMERSHTSHIVILKRHTSEHAPSLRGMYSAALAPKPKNVAIVSPVIGDDDDDENPLEPHDHDDALTRPQDMPPHMELHTKSSLRPSSSSSTLRFPFGRGSNQEDAETAGAAGKYAVVGQKQQWRRNRSQRTKAGATIRHVSEDELDGNGETREELGERASSYLSTARSERPDVPALAWPSTGRSQASSQHSGRESDRSGSSSGRHSSLYSDDGSERELFSVTRQKKSRFAAKLYMPGQNPLYLGRYRSEEAARAACEEAFATITTPRK